jgi:hypothetical protein
MESGETERQDMMHPSVDPGGDDGFVGPFLSEVATVFLCKGSDCGRQNVTGTKQSA